MYNFILNQWVLRKYDGIKVQNCVGKGFITQEQASTILATEQVAIEGV